MAVKKLCLDAKKFLEKEARHMDQRGRKNIECMLNNERVRRMSEKEPYRSSSFIGLRSTRGHFLYEQFLYNNCFYYASVHNLRHFELYRYTFELFWNLRIRRL